MKCIYLATSISLLFVLGWGESLPPQTAGAASLVAERPDMGHPRRGTRRGGGSRGGVCDLPPEVPPLTALMPDTSTWDSTVPDEIAPDEIAPDEIVFSFTTSASPDLWFYLPYPLVESSQVTFTLKAADETLKRVQLDTTQPLPAASSMIRVSLAELELTLTPDMEYHWYLTVNCEAGPTVSVDGWINYRPGELDPATDRFLVDSLSAIAAAQLSNPGDEAAQTTWRETLESVGLSDITDAPLTDCCSFVE